MTERRRTLASELVGVTLFEAAKLLFLFLLSEGVALLGSRVLTLTIQQLQPLRWYLALILGSLTGFFFVVIYTKYSRFRPIFPSIDFDFVIMELVVSFDCQPNRQIEYRKKKRLRALKKGLNVYHDRYHWTGSSLVRVTSAIPEQRVRLTSRRSVWQLYDIELPKSLNKAEEIDTELVWHMDDSTKTAVPFVSATIEEPTRTLEFQLKFAPELGVKEVTCEVLGGISAKKPFESKTLRPDRTGRVTWKPEPPHPRLLYYYEVRWTLPNGSSVSMERASSPSQVT